MGILERVSTLVRANINAMLDGAEDPEIMLSQILRDMEVEIGKARSQVAEMMAQERLFRDDLKEEEDKARHLESRAEHYVRQGNDTMAREALKRKGDSDANIAVIQQQLAAQSDMTSRLREQLEALQEKYKQSLSNRDNLLARYRRAKVQQQVTKTMSSLDITDYSGDLARMEQRIRMAEARSGAEAELTGDMMGDDLSNDFDDAERGTQVDDALAELKARMGMGGSGAGGSSDGTSSSDGSSSGEGTRNLSQTQG
jgi:phage shock protein A